jgi:hypothetical protein
MSESTTRKRIVNMWSNVTGVRTWFYQIPRKLLDAQLPAVVVFPGAATYDTDIEGEQIVIDTRLYEMCLYIERASLDTEGQGEINADPFFDAVRDYFLARPGLELDSEGAHQSESQFDSALLGDSGLSVGPYPLSGQDSPNYIQIRFRLQVKELAAVTYHD